MGYFGGYNIPKLGPFFRHFKASGLVVRESLFQAAEPVVRGGFFEAADLAVGGDYFTACGPDGRGEAFSRRRTCGPGHYTDAKGLALRPRSLCSRMRTLNYCPSDGLAVLGLVYSHF